MLSELRGRKGSRRRNGSRMAEVQLWQVRSTDTRTRRDESTGNRSRAANNGHKYGGIQDVLDRPPVLPKD